jgi:hypothetical protein
MRGGQLMTYRAHAPMAFARGVLLPLLFDHSLIFVMGTDPDLNKIHAVPHSNDTVTNPDSR